MSPRLLPFVFTLAIGVLPACGIVDDLKNQLDDLKDNIQLALDGVKGTAEAAGGAAGLVTADEDAMVEVTDADSPIFGSAVALPAGSLPEGVTMAVVSIVPADVSGAGFHTAAAAATLYVTSGPSIEITLQKLPELNVIQPILDATVTLPLVAGPTGITVETSVVVAHIGAAGEVDPLVGTVNAAGDRVTAETPDFSPFVAARKRVIVPPPVLFSYAVTKFSDGTSLCSGEIEINTSAPLAVTYSIQENSNGQNIETFFSSGNVNFYSNVDACEQAAANALPGATATEPIDHSSTCAFFQYRFQCGDTVVDLQTDNPDFVFLTRSVGFSNFNSTSNTPNYECFAGDVTCKRHVGTVRADFDLKFHAEGATGGTDGVATVTFDAIANGKWDVVDPDSLPTE